MATIISSTKDAALLLKKDEIVAIPTETVYGLAGNAFNETALKKIFQLKQRPFYNPLIMHIKSIVDLPLIASEIPDTAKLLAIAFWPGPLTLVLKKQAVVPDLVTAGKSTVAVRVPNHPTALALLEQLDFPLAAPSANPFGSISPTKSVHVAGYFKDSELNILEGGECQSGIESTIVGFEEGTVVLYRLGSITVEAIEFIVGPIKTNRHNETAPNAPGMLSKHYSPKTKTVLTSNILDAISLMDKKRIGILSFQKNYDSENTISCEILSPEGSLTVAATNLYAAMHTLDQLDLDVILAERFPDYGLGLTINDRLERAAQE
jgi:L-threonylcarbamoyladenylate synthase